MSAPQLAVSITADLSQLRAGLSQATSATTSSAIAITTSVAQIDRSFVRVNNTRFTFGQNFRAQAAMVATGVKPVIAGANLAGFALTNLGRVAQDAPFGFIGIQNNLNPLLESFQRLRAETGSNAAAFKALYASLLGPAGIGIALSLITSAISFYTLSQQRAKKATKEAKDGNDDYIESLDAVTQSRLKGEGNAQKEITDLRTIYSVTQDATLSLKLRKEAVDELQAKYPDYFKNLSDESILNGKAKVSYDQLTTAIIATAKARAAQDLITKNSSQRLINEQKITDLEKERLSIKLKQDKIASEGIDEVSQTTRESAGIKSANQLSSINGVLNKNLETQIQLKNDNKKIDEDNLNLTKSITAEILKGADVIGSFGTENSKSADKISDIYKQLAIELKQNPLAFGATNGEIVESNIESYQKALEGLIANGYAPTSKAVQDLIDKQNELVAQFQAGQKSLTNNVSPTLSTPSTVTATIVDKPIASKQLSEYIKLSQAAYNSTIKFEESLTSLSNESLASGISSAFSSIGEAFANGTSAIDAFGEAILGAFAGFLSQLGQMFIKEGIAQVAYGVAKNIILPGSGASNIGGGIGMIAAGAGISVIGGALTGGKSKNKGSKGSANIPQFASGVNNFSGGMALVGERGPEFVNLPTGSSVTPNFRTSQIMSENRQDTNVFINGQLRADTRGIYLALETEGKKLGRRGYGK